MHGDGNGRSGRPKMTWRQLTERDCREWKFSAIDPHDRDTWRSGPGCSKRTMPLVNASLKFQTLISQVCQYFLSKKCEKLLVQKLLSFFRQKISVYSVLPRLRFCAIVPQILKMAQLKLSPRDTWRKLSFGLAQDFESVSYME